MTTSSSAPLAPSPVGPAGLGPVSTEPSTIPATVITLPTGRLRSTTALTRSTATLNDPTPAKLRALQNEVGYPMISVLVSTAPDLEIDATVVARMKALLRRAETRLAKEMDASEAADVIAPIEEYAMRLLGQRSGQGLALYGSASGCSAWRIGSRVEDRVVIDPTFATRDLARSLALNPRYRLLVLGRDMARMFIGSGNRLQEVTDGGFPMQRLEVIDRGNRSAESNRMKKDLHFDAVFVRQVAASMGAHGDSVGLPLVAIVSATMGTALRDCETLNPVGTVTGSYERIPRSRLVEVARPCIDAHLASTREAAQARLEHARRTRRSALGINHVWTAAQQQSIETLLVEETFRYPAWTTLGGRRLVRAFTVDAPEVIDDAVDEIIEMVQQQDGQVCFVPAGELGGDRIAAVLKRKVS